MPILARTEAQRSQIDRPEAAPCPGPHADEGQARSRLNALEPGLGVATLAPPDQGRAESADRERDGLAPDRPRDPAAVYLARQAARATIRLDRRARFPTAGVGRRSAEPGRGARVGE